MNAYVTHKSAMDWINKLRNDMGLANLVNYSSWFYCSIAADRSEEIHL